jgi:curli biogenesis system outer membrane secretion channel CsgG
MPRTLIILMSLIIIAALSGCGSTATQPSAGNANQGASNTAPLSTNTGGSAGSGPQNQGIGGGAAVNGNSRVEPPGAGSSGSLNSNK